jgi:hypothetical protein
MRSGYCDWDADSVGAMRILASMVCPAPPTCARRIGAALK